MDNTNSKTGSITLTPYTAPCPHCGFCPTCGRAYETRPIYIPMQPWPWHQPIRWDTSTPVPITFTC